MGFRFQRRITIAPGVSLNLSKSGVGISVGPRGAKVGFGPRGIHRSVGIPGTGLHYREEIRWTSGQGERHSSENYGSNQGVLVVRDSGSVALVDQEGNPVSPRLAKLLREQNADQIQSFLERTCEKWNAGINDILTVHVATPDPAGDLEYQVRPYEEPRPASFVPRRLGFLGRVWRPRREHIEQENEASRTAHANAVAEWNANKDRFDAEEKTRQQDYETLRHTDVEAMERVLADQLATIAWPRATEVSYQIRDKGQELWLDVDLPEIGDMPTESAVPAGRGLGLNIKSKSGSHVRREYMQHVHGVVFRIIGEVFFVLPSVRTIVASGYSQRPDPTTGHVRDDYLISAKIARAAWSAINFENLAALDVVACFERFDLKRKMTKTGMFTPIDPHVQGEG